MKTYALVISAVLLGLGTANVMTTALTTDYLKYEDQTPTIKPVVAELTPQQVRAKEAAFKHLTNAYELMANNLPTLIATPEATQVCMSKANEGLSQARQLGSESQIDAWLKMKDACKLGL